MKLSKSFQPFALGLIFLFLSTLASPALAWDGQRHGFILGGGLGMGYVSYEVENRCGENDLLEGRHFDSEAYVLHLKIGYGVSNQLLLFWTSENILFGDDYDNGITLHGIDGIGATYYLNPSSPSFYFSTAFGYSTWNPPFYPPPWVWLEYLQSNNEYLGLGVIASIGYEFARHYSAELTFTWGKPTLDNPIIPEELACPYIKQVNNALSLSLTINTLGY